MKAETIREYHDWADKGLVTALMCKNHEYHRLMPVMTVDGLILVCPRGDYRREVGQVEYRDIQNKNKLALWLWNDVGVD